MNNYIKILLYLKQFEGDAKHHNVELILDDIPLKTLGSILYELKEQDFVKFKGREQRFDSFIYTHNRFSGESTIEESPFNELNKLPPDPYEAMITFKGSRYLKEELEMQQAGKYNINVDNGSTANLILESTSSTITSHSHVKDRIEKIADTLKSDTSISELVKTEVLIILNQAMLEMTQENKVILISK
ncbi:hypothetical protein [Dyadobacter psychrotolerans]|uniref:Uncharacterized protein n=1 Tax=Dyadobacter psychrotolerans TaxID=2541721 RepID=A0A4R5D5C7_9BACT|nr:hypothetical protein [Dyadobacter psychrotolerans]TDE08652.1 hypothetical protein E0F88_31985 [Dyadobacter psychrotolerans]